MKSHKLNFLCIFVLAVLTGVAVSEGEESGGSSGGETELPGNCKSDEQCDSVCQTEEPPQKGSCLEGDCICLPDGVKMPQDVIDDETKNREMDQEEAAREDEEAQTPVKNGAGDAAEDDDGEKEGGDNAAEEGA